MEMYCLILHYDNYLCSQCIHACVFSYVELDITAQLPPLSNSHITSQYKFPQMAPELPQVNYLANIRLAGYLPHTYGH